MGANPFVNEVMETWYLSYYEARANAIRENYRKLIVYSHDAHFKNGKKLYNMFERNDGVLLYSVRILFYETNFLPSQTKSVFEANVIGDQYNLEYGGHAIDMYVAYRQPEFIVPQRILIRK